MRARFTFALSGKASAMATTCTPGVFGTCARYIAANFPAPIRPTRSGFRCAARCCNALYRLIWLARSRCHRPERCLRRAVSPLQPDGVGFEQAFVGIAFDRREVAVRDVLWPIAS